MNKKYEIGQLVNCSLGKSYFLSTIIAIRKKHNILYVSPANPTMADMWVSVENVNDENES